MFGVIFRFRHSLPSRFLPWVSFHFFRSMSTVLSSTAHIYAQHHSVSGLCISWANNFESLVSSHEKAATSNGHDWFYRKTAQHHTFASNYHNNFRILNPHGHERGNPVLRNVTSSRFSHLINHNLLHLPSSKLRDSQSYPDPGPRVSAIPPPLIKSHALETHKGAQNPLLDLPTPILKSPAVLILPKHVQYLARQIPRPKIISHQISRRIRAALV